MQGFIQISQVFPSHPFPVPGSSPGIHVAVFQIYVFGCVRSHLLHPGSRLHHVGPFIAVHRLSRCGIQA